NDTWVLNGTTWSRVATTGPSPRIAAVAAALNGKVVLFGGYDAIGQVLSDTWTWDGTRWTEQFPATSPDPAYYANAVALDGKIVLLGGFRGNYTWTWDGSNWTLASNSMAQPSYQRWAAAAACLADTQNDPLNCGTCGNVCPTGTSCFSGACAKCGADLQNDPMNCGACGHVCPA